MSRYSKFSHTMATASGKQSSYRFEGGHAMVTLTGAFNSSTITLEVSIDNGSTYASVKDIAANAVSATDDVSFNVILPTSCFVRFDIAGTTTLVTANVSQCISQV